MNANNMLIKKILSNELTAFMVAFICCYLIADFVAQIICEKIEERQAVIQKKLLEDLKYRDTKLEGLLKENLELNSELELLKKKAKPKANNIRINKAIIMCDKCYNKYYEENTKTGYFIQNIRRQYCCECFDRLIEQMNKQSYLKRSKSDSQICRLIE
jgi:hypothetical protein